jgi:hypothetical protein
MSYSTRLASGLKQAIDNGTMSHNSDQLYIWEKRRSEMMNKQYDGFWEVGIFLNSIKISPNK